MALLVNKEKYIFDLMTHSKKIPLTSIMLITALALVVYNIVRAYFVTITHDEALTYQLYITSSFAKIVADPQLTANNHILNSLLAKISISIFGDSLLVMRLPNILAHVVYICFSFLLARRLYTNQLWILCTFLALQLNPFMFEFWGLCRGYGLVAACVLGSLFFLLRYYDTGKMLSLIVSMLILCVGIYSNFAMLNFAMGWLCVLISIIFLKGNLKTIIQSAIATAIAVTTSYLLLAKPIEILKERNELYYGGNTGFIKDTIGTLIQHSFYLKENNTTVFYISIIIAAMIIISGLYSVGMFLKNKKKNQVTVMLWLLLIVPALSCVVQFYLLGTKYLLDRTALFFFPIFLLYLFYFLQALRERYKRIIDWSVLFITLLLTLNFIARVNFRSTTIWDYDQHSPWLIEKMIEHKKNEGSVRVYLDWMYIPSLSYYINKDFQNQFDYIEKREEVAYNKEEYDFYLIRDWERHKIPDIYELDTVFADGQFYLYKRKQWDNNRRYKVRIPKNPIFTK